MQERRAEAAVVVVVARGDLGRRERWSTRAGARRRREAEVLRRATRRRRRVAGFLVVLVVMGLWATAAHAQAPSPSGGLNANRCASGPSGASGLGAGGSAGGGGGGGGGGSWGGPPSAATPTGTTMPPAPTLRNKDKDEDEENGLCATLMETIVPGDNAGPYPTSSYDLGYDQGGALSLWRKASGFLMDQTFSGARWFVKIGLWATNWSLEFKFAEKLAEPAQRIADTYRTQVVERLGLERFFLILAALYGGWLALRGRLARGASEFMLSILIVALAATVLSNPARFLLDGLKFTSGLSYEVAALTASADPAAAPSPESANVAKPMLASIHRAFVETPHEILNWGRQIPKGDPCRGTYEAAVASGPWGPADKPRDAMKDAGCGAEAKFNHDPSGDRVLGAFLVFAAAVLVMILLMLVAGTLVAAQLGVVIALALSPFALVLGALPGGGRVLFWRWVASYLQALAGVVMMAVMLALFLVGTSALLLATDGDALIVQMGSIVVVVLIALIKRRRLLERGQRAVAHLTQRLSHARIGAGGAGGGGGRGWVGPGLAGAAVGFGADEVFDHLRQSNRQVRGAIDSHHRRKYQRVMVNGARQRADHRSYPAGPSGGGGGRPGGPGAALPMSPAQRLAGRLQHTRPGRAAVAGAAVAAGGTALALKATAGAPVYWPRWKHQASEAATTRVSEMRTYLAGANARARHFGQEWVEGARAPVRGARNAWHGARRVGSEAMAGARVSARGPRAWATGDPEPVPAPSPTSREAKATATDDQAPPSPTAPGQGNGSDAPVPSDGHSPQGRSPRDSSPRRPMTRAQGATPLLGDVISFRESGPTGTAAQRGKVVGFHHDEASDQVVPIVRAGPPGQTRPAPDWDRIVRGAPAPRPAETPVAPPQRRAPRRDAAAELDSRLRRRRLRGPE